MKRVFSILLVLLLFCLPVTSAFAAVERGPELTILLAESGEEGLAVTLRFTRLPAGGQATLLLYDDETNELLFVAQTPAAEGVQTLALTPLKAAARLRLQVGASDLANYRSVTFAVNSGYAASAVGFLPGQRAGEWLQSLELPGAALTRGGNPLGDNEPMQPGDMLAAKNATGAQLNLPVVAFGDVNTDGSVNAADALQVLRAAVGKATLSPLALAAADFRQQQTVNAATALLILRFAVGKIPSL